ncbi:MAG: 23S rRNA (uracil(1939)-C(5))-methyltransferase RlmD [Synechococcus sp.]|nr:23S rRNA (uracil(1939)-C(5))-methyltransferase RlmD [Synechococcus sp.]
MPETNGAAADPTSPRPGLLVQLTATDLDRNGDGLARWNNWVIVVPGLLPGESADVQLQQRVRSRWLSRVVHRHNDDSGRRQPPCILARDCGGCSLQHLEDSSQHRWKQSLLSATMQRIGAVTTKAEPVMGSANGMGYRNRALIPMHRREDGTLRLGYYRRGSHRIVNLNRCPILDPRLDALIPSIKHDLEGCGLPADHDLRSGDALRHLGLRIGHHTGDILITLVSSSPFPALKGLAERWMGQWPKLRGVTLNLQPRRNNLILGTTTHCLAGDPCITEQFCGLNLSLSSTTFFQINTPQAERIVQCIATWLDHANISGRVIDAYCGIGTISLPLAAKGMQVFGIEISADSIDQARVNAARNQLADQTEFIAGDVAVHLRHHLNHCSALVLDPPRKGLDGDVIEAIVNNPPDRLAYLSCDVATQARDLKRLLSPEGVYELIQLQPIDFFPQTTHLENLALLQRRELSS